MANEDSIQAGTSSGTGNRQFETENERFYKRKLEEMSKNEAELKKQLAEAKDVKKPKIDEFQDFLRENENLSDSRKRRLRYLRRSQPFKVNATVKKIATEASFYLTDEFKDTMAKISGQDWPNEVAACSDFNTGNDTYKNDNS